LGDKEDFISRVIDFVLLWKERRSVTLKRTRPPLTTFFNHKYLGKKETLRDLIIRLSPTLSNQDKDFFGELMQKPCYQPYKGVKTVNKDTYQVVDYYPWYKKIEKRVVLPTDKIKNGVVPENVKDALPIRPSFTAKWRGFVNQPVGAFPQKFVQTDPVFKQVINT